ncbi:GNAT family acetyltransferase [Deinococcus arenae]|uniref:GNAT family acetyltransferase n=1 Tax=Deinococcus arenae TaxID=1452751 RepID=A0A8H9L7U3_9DEIO|nr:GNAT family N-acetyltransferase [Deinococcus arenae]AWT34417.1 GNAT family N-acetyltransferase [Deinococcus actinosclerus]GGM48660.1 GNAT family acetyltransferase [Deinococcus arenae]
MTLRVEAVSGPDLAPFIADLARLRITVFREFPYLYEGSATYEETYLRTYLDAPDAVVLLARDGERVVGASSALPLTQETAEIRAPFVHPEFDERDVLYLGESVLLPEYRGRGLGHAFFDGREAHARTLGLGVTAFCAVQRPGDHPLRPRPYRPLNAFWAARGYVERPDLQTTLAWPDVGEGQDTPKPMRFWVRREPT